MGGTMPEFRATIIEDFQNWQLGTVRLIVSRDRHDGYCEVLQEDGSWLMIPDGTAPERPPGVVLPRQAVEGIAAAIERWQGNANHGATEAKVLREWLDAERRRVDHVLDGCTWAQFPKEQQ